MPLVQKKTNRRWRTARHYAARILTFGGLNWRVVISQLWTRSDEHDLLGRAAQLSYFFVLALFPLLIFVSAIVGHLFAQEQELYLRILSYLRNVMPPQAFDLLADTLRHITNETTGGKVTFGLVLSMWVASSGMEAIINGLNVAYDVREFRPWWRRRLTAIVLIICLAVLIAAALFLILASRALAVAIGNYVPALEQIGRLSTAVQWLAGILFLLLALSLLFRFAPNLRQPRWEANLPGAAATLICWVGASVLFKLYLRAFGSLDQTYGSLGAMIALLIWLYVSGAAVLIGGELNSVIWQAELRAKALK
jgi:membrane protein